MSTTGDWENEVQYTHTMKYNANVNENISENTLKSI